MTLLSTGPAHAAALVEPVMRLAHDRGPPTIAMTFDACGGKTDLRILDVLTSERIPATIFVTSIWLRRNPQALAILLAHPDLFQIENHGRHHVPAVDSPIRVFGLKGAGSAAAVAAEVEQGREDIFKASGRSTRWFRGAAAVYTHGSMAVIAASGQRLAGFSIAADGGTLLSRRATLDRMLSARDSDILLAHINHPERTSGEGVAEGLRQLKALGYRFVRLNSIGITILPASSP